MRKNKKLLSGIVAVVNELADKATSATYTVGHICHQRLISSKRS
jgi:hypothetical protein